MPQRILAGGPHGPTRTARELPPKCSNCGGVEFVWANEIKTGHASGGLSLRPQGEVPIGTRICKNCGHADLFLHNLDLLNKPHLWKPGEFFPISGMKSVEPTPALAPALAPAAPAPAPDVAPPAAPAPVDPPVAPTPEPVAAAAPTEVAEASGGRASRGSRRRARAAEASSSGQSP